jgi:hypothetical protein
VRFASLVFRKDAFLPGSWVDRTGAWVHKDSPRAWVHKSQPSSEDGLTVTFIGMDFVLNLQGAAECLGSLGQS